MPIQPTVKFIRIIYDPGTGAVTIDIDDGLLVDSGEIFTPFSARQIATSGVQETVFFRNEETRQLLLQWGQKFLVKDSVVPAGSIRDRLKTLLETHANKGKQFELLVDRFTGARFEFDGDLLDENGNAATYTPGSATFVSSSFDQALTVAAADHVEITRVPQTNNPTLVSGEGTIVVVVKPAFAGSDGILHTFLDSGGATSNRLTIRKTAADNLELEILDNASGSKKVSGAVSWVANAEQTIIAVYQTDGAIKLFLNGADFGVVSGAGTGQLNSLGTLIFLASDRLGADRAAGDYERTAFFTKGYALNAGLVKTLKSVVSRDRNYYAKAELFVPTGPQRISLVADLYQMQLTIRKGI